MWAMVVAVIAIAIVIVIVVPAIYVTHICVTQTDWFNACFFAYTQWYMRISDRTIRMGWA
jgi:hypothetical protein